MPKTNNTSSLPANSDVRFQKRVFGVKAALILLLALLCFLPACKKSANDNGSHDLSAALPGSSVNANGSANANDGLIIQGGLAEKVLLTAYSQIGARYRFGGTSPNAGFDCSGFTRWVYAQNGINLPRSSSEQFRVGRAIAKDDVKPGDLLIFKRYRNSRSTHVGIYVGNGKYIHSPSKGKTVHEAEAFTGSAGARFLGARRVFEDPSACALTANQKNGAVGNYTASLDDRKTKVELKPEPNKAKNKSKAKAKTKPKTKTSKAKNSNTNKNAASKSKNSKKS